MKGSKRDDELKLNQMVRTFSALWRLSLFGVVKAKCFATEHMKRSSLGKRTGQLVKVVHREREDVTGHSWVSVTQVPTPLFHYDHLLDIHSRARLLHRWYLCIKQSLLPTHDGREERSLDRPERPGRFWVLALGKDSFWPLSCQGRFFLSTRLQYRSLHLPVL